MKNFCLILIILFSSINILMSRENNNYLSKGIFIYDELHIVDSLMRNPESIKTIILDTNLSDISEEDYIKSPSYLSYIFDIINKGSFKNYYVDYMSVKEVESSYLKTNIELLIIIKSRIINERIWFFFEGPYEQHWKLTQISIDPDDPKHDLNKEIFK